MRFVVLAVAALAALSDPSSAAGGGGGVGGTTSSNNFEFSYTSSSTADDVVDAVGDRGRDSGGTATRNRDRDRRPAKRRTTTFWTWNVQATAPNPTKPPTKPPTWPPTWTPKPTTKPPTWAPTWPPTTKPPTWNPTWKPTTTAPTWPAVWAAPPPDLEVCRCPYPGERYCPNPLGCVEYPDPNPPPPPRVERNCKCEGGMKTITLEYAGSATQFDVNDDKASMSSPGPGILVITTSEDKLKSDVEIEEEPSGYKAKFHTSCSKPVLGYVDGPFKLVGYVNKESGNAVTLDACPPECVGGVCSSGGKGSASRRRKLSSSGGKGSGSSSSHSGTYMKTGIEKSPSHGPPYLSPKKGLLNPNDPRCLNIKYVCKKDLGKYDKPWDFKCDGSPLPPPPTNPPRSYIPPPPPPPPNASCECKGGIKSMVLQYAGSSPLYVSGNGRSQYLRDDMYLISTDEDKLDQDLDIRESMSPYGRGAWHTSCSQPVLGVPQGPFRVVAYTDKEDHVIDLAYCPPETDSSSGKGSSRRRRRQLLPPVGGDGGGGNRRMTTYDFHFIDSSSSGKGSGSSGSCSGKGKGSGSSSSGGGCGGAPPPPYDKTYPVFPAPPDNTVGPGEYKIVLPDYHPQCKHLKEDPCPPGTEPPPAPTRHRDLFRRQLENEGENGGGAAAAKKKEKEKRATARRPPRRRNRELSSDDSGSGADAASVYTWGAAWPARPTQPEPTTPPPRPPPLPPVEPPPPPGNCRCPYPHERFSMRGSNMYPMHKMYDGDGGGKGSSGKGSSGNRRDLSGSSSSGGKGSSSSSSSSGGYDHRIGHGKYNNAFFAPAPPGVFANDDWRCQNVVWKCPNELIPGEPTYQPDCDVERPPPEKYSCECKGGMKSITFEYGGSSPLGTNDPDATVAPGPTAGTVMVITGEDKLEKNLEIWESNNRANNGRFHTSCSQPVLDRVDGPFRAIAYRNKEGAVVSLAHGCPPERSSGSGKGSSGKGSSGKGSSGRRRLEEDRPPVETELPKRDLFYDGYMADQTQYWLRAGSSSGSSSGKGKGSSGGSSSGKGKGSSGSGGSSGTYRMYPHQTSGPPRVMVLPTDYPKCRPDRCVPLRQPPPGETTTTPPPTRNPTKQPTRPPTFPPPETVECGDVKRGNTGSIGQNVPGFFDPCGNAAPPSSSRAYVLRGSTGMDLNLSASCAGGSTGQTVSLQVAKIPPGGSPPVCVAKFSQFCAQGGETLRETVLTEDRIEYIVLVLSTTVGGEPGEDFSVGLECKDPKEITCGEGISGNVKDIGTVPSFYDDLPACIAGNLEGGNPSNSDSSKAAAITAETGKDVRFTVNCPQSNSPVSVEFELYFRSPSQTRVEDYTCLGNVRVACEQEDQDVVIPVPTTNDGVGGGPVVGPGADLLGMVLANYTGQGVSFALDVVCEDPQAIGCGDTVTSDLDTTGLIPSFYEELPDCGRPSQSAVASDGSAVYSVAGLESMNVNIGAECPTGNSLGFQVYKRSVFSNVFLDYACDNNAFETCVGTAVQSMFTPEKEMEYLIVLSGNKTGTNLGSQFGINVVCAPLPQPPPPCNPLEGDTVMRVDDEKDNKCFFKNNRFWNDGQGRKPPFPNPTRNPGSPPMPGPIQVTARNGTHATYELTNVWTSLSGYPCFEANGEPIPEANMNWVLVKQGDLNATDNAYFPEGEPFACERSAEWDCGEAREYTAPCKDGKTNVYVWVNEERAWRQEDNAAFSPTCSQGEPDCSPQGWCFFKFSILCNDCESFSETPNL